MMFPDMTKADVAARLQSAVAAGVIDADTSTRLLPFLDESQSTDNVGGSADEEQLRLITGFNDIFVTIGLGLFLGALSYLMSGWGVAIAPLSVAVASWLLAEFFTGKKRMALPSIVLLLSFTSSVLATILLFSTSDAPSGMGGWPEGNQLKLSIAALTAAAAAAAHWFRFAVPITVAAGVAALAIVMLSIVTSLFPDLIESYPVLVFLPIGLAVFATAMWFDMSDQARKTRRTDVAFWLHLLAAPIIVHPVIMGLTASDQSTSSDSATIIAVFLVLCLVALVVDRRALLVSSLGYLAYAAYTIVAGADWSASASAIAALAVGAIVLLLSAAWRPLRKVAVTTMPLAIRQRVPSVS